MGKIAARLKSVMDCLLPEDQEQAERSAGTSARKNLSDGAQAEILAANYLRTRGASVLSRNFQCRGGELDLVALHCGVVLFVEVRLRRRGDFGGAAASITASKKRRVVLAAQHWLQSEGRQHANKPCRFDAILFDRLEASSAEWIPDAFSAEAW